MNCKNYLIIIALLICLNRSRANVRLVEFFPFGAQYNDTNLAPIVPDQNLDDGSSPRINLTSPFRFFNKDYSSLWVNINGGVSFSGPLSTYTPTCAALNEANSMISPFWADIDLRTNKGNVSFRETHDPQVLSRAYEDISIALGDKIQISEMKWAFLATWYQVPFFNDDICHRDLKNTFQLALVTDKKHSYVIFNYNQIQWTTGTSSGAPDCTGRGGSPARAGFDNGRGQMTTLPGSCQDDIVNIASQSLTRSNFTGKFVFKVDGDSIVIPGTNTLPVITNAVTYPSVTETQPIITTTRGPTLAPTTLSEEEIEFNYHRQRSEKRFKDIKTRLLADCDRLIDRPALEKDCYKELEKLNNLFVELRKVKQMDELTKVEKEIQKISTAVDRIEKDISFFIF